MVLVTVDRDDGIAVPGEVDPDNLKFKVDHLALQVRNGETGVEIAPERRYEFVSGGTGPYAVEFPAQLGIEVPRTHPASLIVEAVAYFGDRRIVSRAQRVDLAEGSATAPVDIVLHHSCVLNECPAGQTCVPGAGCQALLSDPTSASPNAPFCDCDSYFPFCVGATWTFNVHPTGAGPDTRKTWTIEDYRMIGPGEISAFLLLRQANDGLVRKWLVLTADKRLFFVKDETFGKTDWAWSSTQTYSPGKMRLSEAHTTVGETFPDFPNADYTETKAEPSLLITKVRQHFDPWDVVRPAEVLYFPANLNDPDNPPLCQHRRDTVLNVDGTPTDEVDSATYCFARGKGKIYEYSVNKEVETMTWFDIPGCGKGTIP